ncbi:response regulator [Desulfitibacter alkalitolerans]|uniref:response regulator n=1 Tax=Desulfitibacter alkalitolerans TaxID=264641 RepID=UPI000484167E|nr:response regulator [Desulfitibacter alkalitolerans]
MLRLLIAEDELIERKSLRFLISKYYQGEIEIVGEAADGKHAHELAVELKPDIILMDIQMPLMDGLQASEMIKANHPDVEILILTAYSYFDYAKKAIGIGISDYLVKPYSDEKLCEAMDKIIQEIRTKKSQRLKNKELQKQVKSLRFFIEKEIILDIIHGANLTQGKIEMYKSMLNIQDETAACMIIRTETDHSLQNDKLLRAAKDHLKSYAKGLIGFSFYKDMVLVLYGDQINTAINSGPFKDAVSSLELYLKQNYELTISIGLGSVSSSFSEMHLSYAQAREYLDIKLTKGSADKNRSFIYEKELHLCESIINQDLDGAIKVFKELFYYCKGLPNLNINNYVKQLTVLIDRNINQFFGHGFKLKDVEIIHGEIDNLTDSKEMIIYFEKLLSDMVLTITEHKKDRTQQVIHVVKEYIDDNYADSSLSLNQVADYIGISSFYLSKCFKKVEGINFKEYLIKVRINRAKHLMRVEKKTVQEAAFAVGYTDPNYFSRAFKNYVGVSPKEYTNK